MKPEQKAAALLREKWGSRLLPVINGVGWPTGEVDWVSLDFNRETGRYRLERGAASRIALADLNKGGGLNWLYAGESCEAIDAQREIKALAGEGSLGGDGFIAVTSTRTGELVWYAFFESSNPFEQVRFEGDALVATTNLGDEWRFPLDSPASFTIKHP